MVGAFTDGGPELTELFYCLRRAAENDTLKKGIRHADGWGMAVVDQDRLFIYRSGSPIYQDVMAPIDNVVSKRALVIIHARYASEEDKVGPQYSHPYLATSVDGRFIYIVAHNGSLDKSSLAEKEGLAVDPTGFVDSELVAQYLAAKSPSDRESLYKALSRLRGYTSTALDLLVIIVNRRDRVASLYAYPFWKGEGDYYRLYKISKGGTTAVVSSTVKSYCDSVGGWRPEKTLESDEELGRPDVIEVLGPITISRNIG
ncbi:MAG: class II glutamine amidotransferase [Acidilobus sp.]